jgi:hypothetical protein
MILGGCGVVLFVGVGVNSLSGDFGGVVLLWMRFVIKCHVFQILINVVFA